ncbi:hypothetical protein GCM10029964_065120 [Kibdelosporangium lantanae]
MRKALAEDEDKPLGTIAAALLDALLVTGDRAGALTTGLKLAPQVPAAVVPALRRLLPALRPALVQPVAEQLADVDWLPVVTSADLDPAVRRGLVMFLGRAYLVLGDTDRAMALLDGSAGIVDDDPELLLLLADCRLRSGQPELAEQALLRADATAGTDLTDEITLRLARLYEEAGRADDVLARLADTPAGQAELFALKALAMLNLGDLEGARAAVATALELAPSSAEAARAGACVRLADHDYQQAKSTADAGLARHPQHRGLSFLRFQAIVEAGEELAQIDRRLARFLGRMEPGEIDRCRSRSERTRSPDDPALHYFLAMLCRAAGQPRDAMREVDTAIRLLGDRSIENPVLTLAHRLRAILLAPDDPGGSAEAYATAGLLAFDQMNYELAADLLTEAGRNLDLTQSARWTLAEALFIESFVPTEPYGVAAEKIHRAAEVWQQAMDRGLPDHDSVWAYITRARICLQLARLVPDPYRLVTEALMWCECFAVCSPGAEAYFQAYGQACRLLGLYGLRTEVLAAVVGPPTARTSEPLPFDELMTSAANGGDLDRMRVSMPVYEFFSTNTTWHEYEARYLQLNNEPAAARVSLDAVVEADRTVFYHLWQRILVDWSIGDHAAVEADLELCVEAAAKDGEENSGLFAWLVLLSGDRERATAMFTGMSDSDSWFTDAAAEVALCRLAGHEPGAEAEMVRYLTGTRSFEDVHNADALLGLLAKRYGETPDGAFARLRALAADRLAEGGWPLTPTGDLDHLRATAAERTDADYVPIVDLATQARRAGTDQRWSESIARYRELIAHVDVFPEVESALGWVANELLTYAAARPTEVAGPAAELAEAIAELRARGSRRTIQMLPENTLGDVHVVLGDRDRASALYESVVAFADADGENRGHAYTRLHVLAALRDQPDAIELFLSALESYEDAGLAPAMSLYQSSVSAVHDPEQWQRVRAVWERGTGSHDFAEELTLAGRLGLANIYADLGQRAEAEPEYRFVVQELTRLAGPDDVDTLAIRHELGRILQQQEKWVEAEAEHRAVLAARTRVLGDVDPDTSSSRWELAWVLYNRGELTAAEEEYRTLVATMPAAWGNESDVLIVRYELGLTLLNMDQYPAALTEFVAAAEGREAVSGPDDSTAIRARFQEGVTVRLLGDPVRAAALFEAVLARQRAVLGDDHPDVWATRHQLGMTMVERGEYAAAVAEYREVVAGRAEALGELDNSTVVTRRELAAALLSTDDVAGAVAEYQAVAAARAQVYGDDAPITLTARRDVAYALYRQDDYEAAEQEYRAVVAGMRAASGDDRTETIGAWHDWAMLLQFLGNAEESARQLRAVLDKMITVYGPDSSDALTARGELAQSLQLAGDWAGAEEQYRAAVAGWARVSGPDAPAVLTARTELAAHLATAGRTREAADEYGTVADARARAVGENDPTTIEARLDQAGLLADLTEWAAAETAYRKVLDAYAANHDPAETAIRWRLVGVLRYQERYAEALTELRTALAGEVAESGELTSETLATRLEIGRTYAQMSEWDSAETELRAVVAGWTEIAGPDAEGTLVARYELARVLADRGDATAAEAEHRAVADLWERLGTPDDPQALLNRYFLAKSLEAQQRWAEAEAEYRAVLAKETRTLGASNPSTLTTQHQLLGVLIEREDWAAAVQEARVLTKGRAKVLGPEHPDTLLARQRLAFVLRELDNLDEARAEYREAVKGLERTLGPDAVDTLITRRQLGGVLYQLGDLPAAETEFRTTLAGLDRTVGPEHPRTISTRLDLGAVLVDRDEFDAAIEYLRPAVADHGRVAGEDNIDTVVGHQRLARALHATGRYPESEVEYRAAAEGWERLAGPDHPDAVVSRFNLGAAYVEQGRYEEERPSTGRSWSGRPGCKARTTRARWSPATDWPSCTPNSASGTWPRTSSEPWCRRVPTCWARTPPPPWRPGGTSRWSWVSPVSWRSPRSSGGPYWRPVSEKPARTADPPWQRGTPWQRSWRPNSSGPRRKRSSARCWPANPSSKAQRTPAP